MGRRIVAGAFDVGDAEIGKDGAAVVEEDVGWLDVTMHDAGPVRRFERPEQVARECQHLGAIQGPTGEPCRERFAVHQVHDVVGETLRLSGVMHGQDAGMLEAGQDPGLAEEPRRCAGGSGFRPEHLDRDVPAEALVVCAKDVALPARGDLVEDGVVRRESGANSIQQGRAGHRGGDARRYPPARNA